MINLKKKEKSIFVYNTKSQSYQKLLDSIREKFMQDLTFEDLTSEEKDCLGCELKSKGITPELVFDDKLPIIKCLLYHLQNRDDWMVEARKHEKELDKLKSTWYFKFTSKLSEIRERLKQS